MILFCALPLEESHLRGATRLAVIRWSKKIASLTVHIATGALRKCEGGQSATLPYTFGAVVESPRTAHQETLVERQTFEVRPTALSGARRWPTSNLTVWLMRKPWRDFFTQALWILGMCAPTGR